MAHSALARAKAALTAETIALERDLGALEAQGLAGVRLGELRQRGAFIRLLQATLEGADYSELCRKAHLTGQIYHG